MHRAILEACFPLFLWFLAGFAALWLLAKVCGARFSPSRLWALHRCERGGVQTVSFVLTLPLFMMIVLFIVQVSQLMIGITVVHYAAFAAARAASVWLAAETPGEAANVVNGLSMSPPNWSTPTLNYYGGSGPPSWKCQKIWSAAVMACYPIAPSHQYLSAGAAQSASSGMAQTTIQLYQTLVPAAGSNARIPQRIMNKAAYAAEHTSIQISGFDYDDSSSAPGLHSPAASYNPIDDPSPNVRWNPNEIGWQDPITVKVWFRFPLLTGPGRFLSPGKFLSARLAAPDGTPDRVSNRIGTWGPAQNPNYVEKVYWTQMTATATLTHEGIKSGIPHVRFPESLD